MPRGDRASVSRKGRTEEKGTPNIRGGAGCKIPILRVSEGVVIHAG